MKSFFTNLNVPLILLLAYSIYFIYLIGAGAVINFPIAIIFAFLVILYGFQVFMNHIKKPEAHQELEASWEDYTRKVDQKLDTLNSKISAVDMANKLAPKVNKGLKHGW